MQKVKITYKGKLNVDLDIRIIDAMKEAKLDFLGSGYNVKTEIRDMSFEDKKCK